MDIPKPLFATKHVLVMNEIKGVKLVKGIENHFNNIATMRGMTLDEMKEEMEEMKREGKVVAPPSMDQLKKLEHWFWITNLPSSFWNWMAGSQDQEFSSTSQQHHQEHRLLDVNKLMTDLFHVHGHQIFVNGAFNGDPHPGNILLTDDGRIGLIDFGQVKKISLDQRLLLAKLIVALRNDDLETTANLYSQMGFQTKNMKPVCLT